MINILKFPKHPSWDTGVTDQNPIWPRIYENVAISRGTCSNKPLCRGRFDDEMWCYMSMQSCECVEHDFTWCELVAGGRVAVTAIFKYGCL